MIITKESDIFQKLLYDVEYLKDVIKLGKYYAGCDPYKEEKKPVFKEGDWVIRTVHKDAPRHHEGYIFRIDKVYGSDIREKDGVAHYASSLRMATNEEIKDHLVRVAIEKGFTGGVKFKWYGEGGCEEVSTIKRGFHYLSPLDALTVDIENSSTDRAVYMQGKWATIVKPQEPPKTTSDLERLFRDFASQYYGSDLYSERDTDVELFLRRNDYK